MNVPFIKMHGLGNDYIFFDCIDDPQKIRDPSGLSRRLADRHFGIGGDGIVLIMPGDEADFRMRMFNADGSEAEMCGNAIRCVGKYIYESGYGTDTALTIQTAAGIMRLQLQLANGAVDRVRVDMGEPILNGPEIPVRLNKNPVLQEPLSVNGDHFDITCVSVGNPHCVIFVDPIRDRHVHELGPRIETNPIFPNRINVEFVKVLSKTEIEMRVWERGSGETMACGTGACAVGVAAALNGYTGRRMTVHLRGGDLDIEWASDNRIYMSGGATVAFKGTVWIDDEEE